MEEMDSFQYRLSNSDGEIDHHKNGGRIAAEMSLVGDTEKAEASLGIDTVHLKEKGKTIKAQVQADVVLRVGKRSPPTALILISSVTSKVFVFLFFFGGTGFEVRVSCLLSRCSVT
jgi:hypothetical protein